VIYKKPKYTSTILWLISLQSCMVIKRHEFIFCDSIGKQPLCNTGHGYSVISIISRSHIFPYSIGHLFSLNTPTYSSHITCIPSSPIHSRHRCPFTIGSNVPNHPLNPKFNFYYSSPPSSQLTSPPIVFSTLYTYLSPTSSHMLFLQY
jgi:hypothetical protein